MPLDPSDRKLLNLKLKHLAIPVKKCSEKVAMWSFVVCWALGHFGLLTSLQSSEFEEFVWRMRVLRAASPWNSYVMLLFKA